MNSLKTLFLKCTLTVTCMLALSCSKSENSSTPADPFAFKYGDVIFKVDRNQLTETQKTLITTALLTSKDDYIRNAALISQALIIQHTAAAHVNSTSSDVSSFKQDIDFLSLKNPYDLKYAIEDQIEKKFGSPLKYNYDMSSMLDIINGNQVQCFSGSMLYGSLALVHSTVIPTLNNLVMIHTSGHILPGFTDEGQLFGIEMTVAGKGEVKYGSLQKPLPLNTIVVQLNYALLASALKTALLDMATLRNSIIEASAKSLNLKYQPNALDVYASYDPEHIKNTFNSSIFTFGSANVPKGRVDRPTMDEVPLSTTAPNAIPVTEGEKPIPVQVITSDRSEETQGNFRMQVLTTKQTQIFRCEMEIAVSAVDTHEKEKYNQTVIGFGPTKEDAKSDLHRECIAKTNGKFDFCEREISESECKRQ